MAKVEKNIEEETENNYKDTTDWKQKYWMKRHHHGHHGRNGGNAVYFFGFIGALIYYWQHANTFWDVVMGLLQAIVWPAILIWHLFGLWKL